LGSPFDFKGEGSRVIKKDIKGEGSRVRDEEEEEYNPLKIPADWEFARKHGMARSVGKPLKIGSRNKVI
jgi:hypothetical protein